MLVGDALGVPYEFHRPDDLPTREQLEMAPPPGFRCAHGVPPGTWSDNGAQALCLLDSLLHKGRFDREDFVHRLVRWINEGYLAVDTRVFGVDAQTLKTLRAIRRGVSPLDAAPRGASATANGSLARVLPLALLDHGPDVELIQNAHLQSQITHPHPRCQVSSALYCLWARYELDGRSKAWEGAFRRLEQLYGHHAPFHWDPELLEELITNYGPDSPPLATGSTAVVDSLKSAVSACDEPSYERVVREAVAFGRASGSTACLAGGIAGVRYGPTAIPERWLEALRGKALYAPLLNQLQSPTRQR